MKIVAIVCNAFLFVITGSIALTEGIPGDFPYLVLTVLPLLVPILNVAEFFGGRMTRARQESLRSSLLNRVAVLGNIVLLAFSCWPAIAQYPYREGTSVIPFTLLMVFTPVVSVLVLVRKNGLQPAEL
jgi:hypothetical protein